MGRELSDFFHSSTGVIARHRWRQRRRVHAVIRGVEPAAKHSMPASDKLAIQKAVAEDLAQRRRRPFRGQLALRLSLRTTGPNPAQLPNLGKNLLDLLGQPLPGFKGRRRGILFYDDRQVDALSISCRHEAPGEGVRRQNEEWDLAGPRIGITAVRHRLYVEDLAAGAAAERAIRYMSGEWDGREGAVTEYRRMVDEYEQDRRILAPELHQLYLDLAARQAQQWILRNSGLSLAVLALLHGVSAEGSLLGPWRSRQGGPDIERLVESQTRILLGELPVRSGEGAAFKERVVDAVDAFWRRWDGLFGDRLRVPIAMEVLVKPPLGASHDALHDLDNIVRTYLVKPIIARLQPPIEYVFGVDEALLKRSDGALPTWVSEAIDSVPKSVRVGLTRYEVWRIPRSKDDQTPGFVSVGFAPDLTGVSSAMIRSDIAVDEWSRRIRDNDMHRW